MTSPITTVPIRRDQYVEALIAGSPTMTPQVRAALTTALALALTARSDGTHALLSAAQLGRLVSGAGGERTAVRHLQALRAAGWLEQTSRGGLRGKKAVASVYSLCVPQAMGGVFEIRPNTPRRKPQHATGGVPLLPSKEGSPAHSGARSREVARDPVRKKPGVSERELTWPAAKAAGDEAVFAWLLDYVSVAGANQAVAWLLLHEDALWDFAEVGLPQSRELSVNRLLWMCWLSMQVTDAAVDFWNWPNVEKAIRGAMRCGYTEPVAWSLLWCLAYADASSPLRLDRLLNEDIQHPATQQTLADAKARLSEWEAVAAERQGRKPIADAFDIPMVPTSGSVATDSTTEESAA